MCSDLNIHAEEYEDNHVLRPNQLTITGVDDFQIWQGTFRVHYVQIGLAFDMRECNTPLGKRNNLASQGRTGLARLKDTRLEVPPPPIVDPYSPARVASAAPLQSLIIGYLRV